MKQLDAVIKIFYVIDSFDIGGAQRQLLELMRRLDRQRYQAVVCPLWPLMALEADYHQTGWPIIRVHKKSHLDITVAWRLAKEMMLFRPHIVHTWLFTGNLWGRLAAALAKVPCVIASERTVVPNKINRPDASLINCILSPATDVMLVNSEAGLNKATFPIGYKQPHIKVIYNGVDLARFDINCLNGRRQRLCKSLNISHDSLILGNVGRLSPQKGHFDLLEAFSRIKESDCKVTMVIVGGGAERPKLETKASDLDVSHNVRFLGPRYDIPQLLSIMDIFILPSHWEGFPNVILEAMAMGKPVVATDVAGVGEMIEHEVNGLLVPPNNPPMLAQAILRLIRNPELAARLGAAGRQRVEREFSVERMVKATTDLYEELLQKKGIVL